MKINLEIVPVPMISGFTMFAKIDTELLKETKTIRVSNRMETKTRVSTSIHIGEACYKVNWKIDGFKTFEKLEWNYFSGNQSENNYFVLSKKQGIEEYKEYVKKVIEFLVVEKLALELDEITIKLEQPKF